MLIWLWWQENNEWCDVRYFVFSSYPLTRYDAIIYGKGKFPMTIQVQYLLQAHTITEANEMWHSVYTIWLGFR
jgi:hypothetical protein